MEERILANTVITPEYQYQGTYCWIWIGKKVKSNRGMEYGVLTQRYKSGPRKGKVHNVRVHRLVLQLFKGRRMTKRSVGGHLCNVSLCCHPDHVWSMSQRSNVRQCVAEGRHKGFPRKEQA